jgi:hypothetical protein
MIIILSIESIIKINKAGSVSRDILERLKNQTEVSPRPLLTDLTEILGALDNVENEGRWHNTITETAFQKEKNPF